jgi:alpha-glucosidase
MSPRPLPRYDAAQMVRAMRALSAGTPWPAITASMNLLDSHDTARFRTVVGSRQLHIAGAAMLLTWPGVPTWFAGSEVGAEGDSSDTARVPFAWDESTWDHDMLAAAQALNAVRHECAALGPGSLRWLHAAGDAVTFVRELADERIVVHVARGVHAPPDLASLVAADHAEQLFGDDSIRWHAAPQDAPTAGPGAWIWRLGGE